MSNRYNKLSEAAMLRAANKKQNQELYKKIKKDGGDIGDKVRKDQNEDKLSNAIHVDNPWGSSRHIDTYESFQPKNKLQEKSNLEDFYTWIGSDGDRGKGIELNDDTWVKGSKEDLERPMFKNLPDNEDREARNPLIYNFDADIKEEEEVEKKETKSKKKK